MISSFAKLANNMDFKWNNQKTYLVFVPGLSLVIQKIQDSNLLPALKNDGSELSIHKIQRICRFHCLGALAQMTASSVALLLLTNPGLILLAASISLLSTYQFLNITYIAFVKMKLTMQDSSGNFKSANGFF